MSLMDEVADLCRELAPQGWRDLLLEVSLGKMDIAAGDFAAQMTQDLDRINQDIAGFEDFSFSHSIAEGAGFRPAQRLLLHAFASPCVRALPDGTPLGAFATLAQVDLVENLLFAGRNLSLAQVKRLRQDGELGVAVFACEYRPAGNNPAKRCADFCFSRTGIARTGTAPASYDAKTRSFEPLDPEDPFAFRLLPARYVPYLAKRIKGDCRTIPANAQKGDDAEDFWVPLHKLFDGPECIAGLDLEISLEARHVNEKLARLLRLLNDEGYETGRSNETLDRPPFTLTEGLADFAEENLYGPGLLVPGLPANRNLVKAAELDGKPVTLHVAEGFEKSYSDTNRLTHYFDSLYVEPFDPTPESGGGSTVTPTGKSHRTPEIINARHHIGPDGKKVNLNRYPGVYEKVRKGGYDTQLYQDFGADGSIQAHCPQLEGLVQNMVPAYSIVAAPDFFPYCHQLDLIESWRKAHRDIRRGLWAVPPYALCDRRYAPNIYNEAFGKGSYKGGGLADKTVTAIVPLLQSPDLSFPIRGTPKTPRVTYLPDGASGVFDPGWDITTDTPVDAPEDENLFFVGYGLGSPYVEDVKICAALGTFWPAAAPDSTRTFAPYSFWPTICPLTDEEIGQSGDMPWDGVYGPKWCAPENDPEGKTYVDYLDFNYVDYVDNSLAGKLTAALTAKVDSQAYEKRVYAMAWVYNALGVHFPSAEEAPGKNFFARVQDYLQDKAKWAVFSFTILPAGEGDEELESAAMATGRAPREGDVFRFVLFRWDKDRIKPKPDSFDHHLVEVLQLAQAYCDSTQVWFRRSTDGEIASKEPWQVKAIPTS